MMALGTPLAEDILKEMPGEVRTLYNDFVSWLEGEDQEIKLGSLLEVLYYSGLIPGLIDFLKTGLLIEHQISLYLSQLGADAGQAQAAILAAGGPISTLGSGVEL